ncbi:MAG: hypothetical protein ACOCTR_00450 [Candidatus Natronoplasma sp.]
MLFLLISAGWAREGITRKIAESSIPVKKSAEKLEKIASKKGITKARISGGEPTLCRDHLFELLHHLEQSGILNTSILKTNGILFGADSSYVEELRRSDLPYVRVSLKAGLPGKWEDKTGAERGSFDLPYKAIKHLWRNDIDFHVAAMADPRITSKEETREIYRKVAEISEVLAENIEWESIDMYPNTERRLKHAGIELE